MAKLQLRVKELATERGYENAQQLQYKTGITYTQLKRHWDNRGRMVSLDALDAIAKTLGVNPCELLTYKENGGEQSTEEP